MSAQINKTRMTAYIRDSIIAKAIETSGITQRKHKIVLDRAAFVEQARQISLKQSKLSDEIIRQKIAEMDKDYPAGCHARDFLSISFSANYYKRFEINLNGMEVYCWLDGRKFEYYLSGSENDTHLTEQVKAQQKDASTRLHTPVSTMNISSPELGDFFMALEAEQKAIIEDEHNIRRTLTAQIKKFATVEKMLEVWPDSAELLPKDLKPCTDIAINAESLNALCGIPQGK